MTRSTSEPKARKSALKTDENAATQAAVEPGPISAVSRRDLLMRAGVGGGVIVAASVLASTPALAQTPTDPFPSRTGRTPTSESSAAELTNKVYVDTQVATRVSRTGDTMTGNLIMGAGARIGVGTADPTEALHVEGKIRVGTQATAVTDAVAAGRTITTAAGSGLTGGGDLTADRNLAVDSTVVRTTGNQSIGGTKTFTDAIAGSVTGSAARLATARTLWGRSFDGTENVSGDLDSVGNINAAGTLRMDATGTGPAVLALATNDANRIRISGAGEIEFMGPVRFDDRANFGSDASFDGDVTGIGGITSLDGGGPWLGIRLRASADAGMLDVAST